MSSEIVSSNPTVDAYEYLQIIKNSDGTITRNPNRYPNTLTTPDPDHPTLVLSKDIHINQSKNTWVRIFIPRNTPDTFSNKKLPLLVYYHAGGFIHCSAASTIFHNFCTKIVIDLHVVIASVEYRLAPEHRLPAAYDDAVEALHWIKTTHDKWLKEYADFSNCYIMGSSSGGNIAYLAGLRVAAEVDHFEPLMIIKGLILHQPFFGGTQRTGSELRLVNDPRLPQSVLDLMWDMSLPIGVDRDHEYCNPTVMGGSKLLDQIKRLGWKVLVIGCDGDPLIDRQIELVRMLEAKSVQVVGHFSVGGYHMVHVTDPSKAEALHAVLKGFIFS